MLIDVNEYKAVCAVDAEGKKPSRRRKTKNTFCYCCKTRLHLTDHHLKPRSEGGTDHPDNLVTVCRDCHDEVEGPADGAWERVVRFKEQIRTGRIAKTKEDRVNEARECKEKEQQYEKELKGRKAKWFQLAGGAADEQPVPLSLSQLTAKRRAEGYLDPVDGRRYWSLAFGEDQARLLFDAPLQEWVRDVVDRACGRGTFSPDKPAQTTPKPDLNAESGHGTPIQALQNAQELWNGAGIAQNPRLEA